MFKYTKASVNILIADCKRWAKIFKYVSLVGTLALLTYQIINGFMTGNKFLYVNIGLAAAFIIFTALDFVFEHFEMKTAKKIGKRVYKWLKLATKAVTLTITILDIKAAEKLDGVQIILTTLMILLWIASFASEIILEIVTQRANEFIVAFNADVEDIKRPFTAVSNTFKKLTGRQVEEVKVDSKKEKILSKLRDRIDKDKIKDEDDE